MISTCPWWCILPCITLSFIHKFPPNIPKMSFTTSTFLIEPQSRGIYSTWVFSLIFFQLLLPSRLHLLIFFSLSGPCWWPRNNYVAQAGFKLAILPCSKCWDARWVLPCLACLVVLTSVHNPWVDIFIWRSCDLFVLISFSCYLKLDFPSATRLFG
jgi:hypothetical protein